MSGALVKIEEDSGFIYVNEFTSLSNSRQSLTVVGGLNALELTFFPTASASIYDVMDVVLNAVSDSDADTKLATVGARYVVPAGKTLRQIVPSGGTLISRIDVKLRSAASGTNLVVVYGKSPT